MRTLWMLPLGAILLLAWATPARAGEDDPETLWDLLLEKYDANKDGVIQPAEYTRSQVAFRKMDRNQDQVLTSADFRPARPPRPPAREGGGSPPGAPPLARPDGQTTPGTNGPGQACPPERGAGQGPPPGAGMGPRGERPRCPFCGRELPPPPRRGPPPGAGMGPPPGARQGPPPGGGQAPPPDGAQGSTPGGPPPETPPDDQG